MQETKTTFTQTENWSDSYKYHALNVDFYTSSRLIKKVNSSVIFLSIGKSFNKPHVSLSFTTIYKILQTLSNNNQKTWTDLNKYLLHSPTVLLYMEAIKRYTLTQWKKTESNENNSNNKTAHNEWEAIISVGGYICFSQKWINITD